MPSINMHDVSVRFGARTVLSGASLQLSGPSVTSITGPSGAGKTTLLQILGGLVQPQEGVVSVDFGGTSFPSWVVQNAPLFPRRSALDNIAVGGLAMGMTWDGAQSLASEVMNELGIEHRGSTLGYRLSGGEKQRVAVGRAIASGSKLMLADEPTASLDAESRDLVARALQRAVSRGCLVVVTTHDDAVAAQSDRVFTLSDGELRSGQRRRRYNVGRESR